MRLVNFFIRPLFVHQRGLRVGVLNAVIIEHLGWRSTFGFLSI
jgi:hypothetical protein